MTDESNEEPMHVVELVAENVKRLRAVRIRPDGNVVIIGGRNGAGKSSTLDSIEMALAGKDAIPPEPVRRGARRGRIVLDLGELVVERTFTAKGSQLVVRGRGGDAQQGPQWLLDRLCASIAFDPVEFSRMDPRKQDALLKKVLGLDFSDLDKRRASLFEQRKLVNRDVKAAEARADAMPIPEPGLPKREVSVAELAIELERASEERRKNEAVRANVAALRSRHRDRQKGLEVVHQRIAELKAALEDAEAMELKARRDIDESNQDLLNAEARVLELVDLDPAPLREKMANAEQINRQIRSAAEREALGSAIQELAERAEELTRKIAAIDDEKRAALGAAKFPVPGLGFDDVGPTLNGVPLEQASDAEKLRLSVAIGAALHPRIRVMLIRSGSLLDDESMRLLAELAREQKVQLWLERVGDKDPSAIIIEDGAVRGVEIESEARDG